MVLFGHMIKFGFNSSRWLPVTRSLVFNSKANVMETCNFNYEKSSSGHVILHPNKASYEARLPGWSFSDLSTFLPPACASWYLRVWRLHLITESVREVAHKQGFMDLIPYERTNLIYHKCASLERFISVKDLNELGHLPFQYGISISGQLSNLGGTSFQVDSAVSLTETGQTLFKNSVVNVSVDIGTRSVVPHPEWWVTKYKPCLRQGPDFKKLRVKLLMSHKPENLLFKSSRLVQALDIDYYGHVNNNTYPQYAADGILAAQLNGKLRWTAKEVENSIERIDVDFVSDCKYGDLLETMVYKDEPDENKIHVTVCKDDRVIYAQSVLFEPQS